MFMNMSDCTLCPRMCHADRSAGQTGFCRMTDVIYGARAALHFWEEPCISGAKGSGAVFFSGCTLRCIFCQNEAIAAGAYGKAVTLARLAEIFLELQAQGAANINLVTACHFAPMVVEALRAAKRQGLAIPVVYNSSGYERPETLRLLESVVDIWLPDFKYMDEKLAREYSAAADYPEIAKAALAEMVRQQSCCEFDAEGYMTKGVIVRHLILPGHVKNSRAVLQYLHETYGEQIYISVMNQYTPMPAVSERPPLNRKVTKREYARVLDFALDLGIEQGYFQDGGTADESFIPLFNYEGIEKKDSSVPSPTGDGA